jgi:hypothetical protein
MPDLDSPVLEASIPGSLVFALIRLWFLMGCELGPEPEPCF